MPPGHTRFSPVSGLLAVALVFLAVSPASSIPKAHPLKPAPPFVRPGLDGQRIDLATFKGRVVLLTFWATWCIPCQAEIPRFVDWQTRYGPHGLQVIAVSMDDDEAPVRTLATERHINYPVLMGDVQLARLYGGILGLPVTLLIDRKGRTAARFKGEADLNLIEQTMQRLLKAH